MLFSDPYQVDQDLIITQQLWYMAEFGTSIRNNYYISLLDYLFQ